LIFFVKIFFFEVYGLDLQLENYIKNVSSYEYFSNLDEISDLSKKQWKLLENILLI